MTHPLAEQGQASRISDPCIIVIFGATGDLTARKLMPALYNLTKQAQLPAQFACVGFARREKNHDQFREEMEKAVAEFSRSKPIDPSIWSHFKERLFYHCSEFHEPAGYQKLKEFLNDLDVKLGTKGNRIFYLSTQPSFFPTICEKLYQAGLIYDTDKKRDAWSRVIIEKPFGHDLDSADALQKELLKFLKENQIFRIDHYLGKESVQNLLVFRFGNSIFESLWNRTHIDHVQITVAEEIGIGSRGKFYEEAGLLRDIVQNHMMQLLSLVSMEPPANLEANSIRDEKVKVVKTIRPFDPQAVIRGQYGPGLINGQPVIGYRQEGNVSPTSSMETYVALRLFIDNPRWQGVPFYLRGGKRLPKRVTEIAVSFKEPPNIRGEPNVLSIRIQPDEGIGLKINCKVPGPSSPIQPVKMDFRYSSYFGIAPPEAYERLICDCILGDSTLFAREDEVAASWKLFTPILNQWSQETPQDFPNYASGSWGPESAEAMIAQDGRKWRLL
jgi:glucose-6-phosphate 1-dehydrogenase